jgi:hypothetical protein
MGTVSGAAAQWIAKEYGGNFRVRSRTMTVDAASLTVAPNDPDRVALILINVGATSITISFDPTAVINQGIQLLDNGSLYSVNVRDDLIMPAWAHQAIGSAPGGSLFILEVTMESRS